MRFGWLTKKGREALILWGLVFQAWALFAQQPEDHVSALTVNVREVVMDVVAIDRKGHSVTGLKASDFNLVEDGVPLAIKGFSEHLAMTPDQVSKLSAAKLPPNTFTSFVPQGNTNAVTVILIDRMNSPVRAQMYLRQQLISYMKTMPPGNVYAIFELDERIHLVQGFTSDPDVLLKAVESQRESVTLPPLVGGKRSALREDLLNEGLRVMGTYLAGVPGRKNLVWFTGVVPKVILGLKRNLFPDDIDYSRLKMSSANAISLSQIAIYPIDDRGLNMWSSVLRPRMEEVADFTGGKAYFNTNGLKQALTQIAETSSNYYTFAFAPTNPIWRAHHRDVVLTVPGRGDITLLYRHKYYAHSERTAQKRADAKEAARVFTPEKAEAASTDGPAIPAAPKQDFSAEMQLGSVPSGEVLFTATVSPAADVTKLNPGEPLPPGNFLRDDFQKKPFRDYQLLFTVDPSRVAFSLMSDGTHFAQLELVAAVYNPEGEMLNSFLVTREITFDDVTYAKVLKGEIALTSNQAIAVPEKGTYFLKLGIHDKTSDADGAVEIPVDSIQRP